jgi:Mycobacterium 19 kDa lipoprotein antigen
MRNPAARHRYRRTGLFLVALGLSACSPAPPKSAPAPATHNTTVMMGSHTHSITGEVTCSSSAAQPSTTPAESGDLTTRISARDDSASLGLALSDEKPPSVDGFAVSLAAQNGQYQILYQATESPNQVQVTKDGKKYTITGWGQGTQPGQSELQQLTFGIHVVCP